MKKLKVTKKLISSILVAIIVIGQFSGYNFVSRAETITSQGDKLYLSMSKLNGDGNGYAFDMMTDGNQGKPIWCIVSSEQDGSNKKYSSNLYCIKADFGYTWETLKNPSGIVTYNTSYTIPLGTTTNFTTADNVLLGKYKNQLLYLIDNFYVKGESNLVEYLADAGIVYDEYDGYFYDSTINPNHNYENIHPSATSAFAETVTEDDIDAIQQMALWHFTNYGTTYSQNKTAVAPWLQYTNANLQESAADKYPQLLTLSPARAIHATIIYNYLIDEAQAVAEKLGNNQYELKNSTAKLWVSSLNDEQPIIEIHKVPEGTFDLSLRKTIVEIKDKQGNSKSILNEKGQEATRIVNADEGPLNDDSKESTTANYKHRKAPVVVETGDTVKYAITIYNEGEQDGCATIIKDQLPGTWGNGLRLQTNSGTVTSSTGNTYTVSYDTANNIVIFTMGETTARNVLQAYDGEGDPESETIYIECKVMGNPDVDSKKILTNIAYIAEDYNAETETYKDIDSTPGSIQIVDLITNDIGYIGGTTNSSDEEALSSNETYYKGQQDDDDFEKIVILPESFDLSLRKHITKVGNKEVDTRKPEVDTSKLNTSEANTTAKYNHTKVPITVTNGDEVEYKITIYNEGSIDGVASTIKDKLPTGLAFDLEQFGKEGEEYFTTSSTGNKYKVSYDREINLVTFDLVETKIAKIKLLEANLNGDKLAEEEITLKCTVNCSADKTENIYLTNIAYINEAIREDGTENGTIVTQQNANDGTEAAKEADRDSEPYTKPGETADELKTIGELGYTGKEKHTNLSESKYYEGEQDDDDFEKLVILPKTFDLKLIKFITEINDEATGNRVLSVDTSKLNITSEETTADYILEKNPIAVKAGDFVTYTIRVYNEGDYDGYATEISENIPAGLEYLVVEDGGIIRSWDGINLEDVTEEIKDLEIYNKIIENNIWTWAEGNTVIKTEILKDELIRGYGQTNVEYADEENNIDYKEVKVIFRVKADVEANVTIRNEAAITKDQAIDEQGQEIESKDRDSKPEEWKKENSEETYDEEGKWPIYKEDDEDYDNIITKAFDLSLRKQIIQINNTLYTSRYADLLDSKEEQKVTETLYDYYDVYSSKPKVKAGDKVVYSIRVYNEGDIDGYASLIVDELPSGLELAKYVPGDGSINDRYGWKLVQGTENVYQTDYLSYEKDEARGTNLIKAYQGEGEADYKEVRIECIVKENVSKEDSLLNVAQIAEDSDENGKSIKDKDSIPGKEDDENKWKEEDDLDIEILQLQEFDLALRKFITGIENNENTTKITTRIPQVSYDKGKEQIVYTHPKNALVVHVGDTVIYTLRVYNEGDIDGYASEVKDDIPQYLEYLPEHNINIENEWEMFNEDGEKTNNVNDAVFIKTEHLAKGKGVELDEESEESNLIKAFNPESDISETNPDYKEIQVAFKVKDPNSTEYEIVNFAQISEDTDSEGEPIKDRDSVPGNGEKEPKEDDEDIEKVKVEYFDLSLLKYVTKVLVNENGSERVIETGNVGDENDIIPHVQLRKKSINKTVVKFVYTIQITNEGQIAGEATEITDYVPEGLIFVAEDNELWTDEGNNIISTKQLEGTVLEPGETAQVEVVLRWINGSDNLGPKTNIAEISEDYNEENVPDKDSVPDNKENGEDDIDDATVLLSVNQGGGIQSIYINLSLTFLVIILIGGVLIKKFVL